jgi:hypothetical protein
MAPVFPFAMAENLETLKLTWANPDPRSPEEMHIEPSLLPLTSLYAFSVLQAGDKWEAIGKVRAHNDVITGLRFGSRADGQACLVSCAEDGCIVEYDLETVTPVEGLRIKNASAIKSTGLPTSLAFIPGRGGRVRKASGLCMRGIYSLLRRGGKVLIEHGFENDWDIFERATIREFYSHSPRR